MRESHIGTIQRHGVDKVTTCLPRYVFCASDALATHHNTMVIPMWRETRLLLTTYQVGRYSFSLPAIIESLQGRSKDRHHRMVESCFKGRKRHCQRRIEYCSATRRVSPWKVSVLLMVTFIIVTCDFLSAMVVETYPQSWALHAYRYRNAQESDLPSIVDLLEETFESRNEDEDHQDPSRQHRRQLLFRRWTDMVQNSKVPHIWIVAETTDATADVAAFMELGVMPLPVSVVQDEPSPAMQVAPSTWHGFPIEPSSNTSPSQQLPQPPQPPQPPQASRPDRPFLANLAVGKDHRRRGIATKLVQLALKLAQKWNGSSESTDWSMFLGVDKDNVAANHLYTSLNFTVVLDETIALPCNKRDRLQRPARLYYEKKIL